MQKVVMDSGSGAEKSAGIVFLSYGPVSFDTFSKLSKLAGKDAILDADLARMAGASIAAGPRAACAELRRRLEPAALQASDADNPGLSEAAVRWLVCGERGTSSNTMFTYLTGVDALNGDEPNTPYDPGDLRRCRLLLEQVPELQPLLPKMADVSPVWANLVKIWDGLCEAMDRESPGWRVPVLNERADETYMLMRAARAEAEGR